MPKDRALFYCGPVGHASKAIQWAKRENNGCKPLCQLWTNKKYPDAWQYSMDSSEIFFKLASQAMAELSSGVIYIMVPSNTQGTDWWYNSVWNLIKWSNIGPAVTQFIRVNPDTDHQETIKGAMPARSQRRHVQHHHQRRRRRHHRQNYQCRGQSRRRRRRACRQQMAANRRRKADSAVDCTQS